MGKSRKGGYKIISLNNIELKGAEDVEIKGIHKTIESSYRKPLLIEDIVIDGVEKESVFVNELKVEDGAFVIEIYGLKLTISDEDYIDITRTYGVKKDVTIVADYDLEIEDGDEITIHNNTENVLAVKFEDGLVEVVGSSAEQIFDTLVINAPNDNQVGMKGESSMWVKRIGDFLFITGYFEI